MKDHLPWLAGNTANATQELVGFLWHDMKKTQNNLVQEIVFDFIFQEVDSIMGMRL